MTDISLALLEARSVARGIEAADAMLKEAPVALLWSRIVAPGRYLVLLRGTPDDVRQSLRRGRAVAGDDLHDELLLPGPHEGLLDALQARPLEPGAARPEALGLIECASVAATLLAADAAAKQAHVRLLAVRIGPGMHGKGVAALAGDVADVESAVTRGAAAAEERAMLVRSVVIPRAEARLIDDPVGG